MTLIDTSSHPVVSGSVLGALGVVFGDIGMLFGQPARCASAVRQRIARRLVLVDGCGLWLFRCACKCVRYLCVWCDSYHHRVVSRGSYRKNSLNSRLFSCAIGSRCISATGHGFRAGQLPQPMRNWLLVAVASFRSCGWSVSVLNRVPEYRLRSASERQTLLRTCFMLMFRMVICNP